MDIQNKQKSMQEEQQKIAETVSKIKHRIAVFSGKGGVGKTTVSVNLAYAFQLDGFSTGILDADITGPNVAKMLNINGQLFFSGEKILPFEKENLKIISMASLIKSGQPIIWRGALRTKMINQFLADVNWGELEFLIADLPPGTGDEMLTLAQQMKPDYAVVVTTPQEVSVMDAERSINMAKQLNIPSIGVVENMSGLICPHCGKVIDLFGSGGGKKLAESYGLDFLGTIPFEIETRKQSDNGKPIVLINSQSEVSKSIFSIQKKLQEKFTDLIPIENNKQTEL